MGIGLVGGSSIGRGTSEYVTGYEKTTSEYVTEYVTAVTRLTLPSQCDAVITLLARGVAASSSSEHTTAQW